MYSFSVARLVVLPRADGISLLHVGMNRSDLVEYSLTKTVLLSDIFSAHRQNGGPGYTLRRMVQITFRLIFFTASFIIGAMCLASLPLPPI